MSEGPSSVPDSNDKPPPEDESKPEPSPEKRKLILSQSENIFDEQKSDRHKLLSKVKSWSSKEQHPKKPSISVELDLARSLSKLEVVGLNEEAGSSLLMARDSLDILLKDEQNIPKSSLEKLVVQPKPRCVPDSPKSMPQLENWKSSKVLHWDPYDRQGKRNKKDLKKKGKIKTSDSPRNEGSSTPVEGKKTSTMKPRDKQPEESPASEEASVMEEEENFKYKYLPKSSKSVLFTNEVLVVYFNNEDVVGEGKEPLKKEGEQQTRNKEMRRIHLNKTQEKYNLCLF